MYLLLHRILVLLLRGSHNIVKTIERVQRVLHVIHKKICTTWFDTCIVAHLLHECGARVLYIPATNPKASSHKMGNRLPFLKLT